MTGLSEAPRLAECLRRGFLRGAGLAFVLAVSGAGAGAAPCVTEARYAEPVSRYGHDVLGGGGEFGALVLRSREQALAGRRATVTVTLPRDRVFEDLEARVIDLDSDRCPEVVVVESHIAQGAQLAVYDGSGSKIAATPHIGQPYRWLAVVGAADFDGDGAMEIAYVDRPHLAKVLRVWRYAEGQLVEVAQAQGFTNHRIGWDFTEGGIRDCGAGPEMLLPDGERQKIMKVRFDGTLKAEVWAGYAPAMLAAGLECRSIKGVEER